MLGGEKGYHVNQCVNTSPATPLPGLCTSGHILPTDSDVIKSEISPDVQRPGSGVVGLVLTHPIRWCPQTPPIIDFYSEKYGPLCPNAVELKIRPCVAFKHPVKGWAWLE